MDKNVAPRLRALSHAQDKDGVLEWEEFRAQRLYRGSVLPRFLVAVGTSSPALPGIIVTAVLTSLLLSDGRPPTTLGVLYAVSLIAGLVWRRAGAWGERRASAVWFSFL